MSDPDSQPPTIVQTSPLFKLPTELLQQILSPLSSQDLVLLSRTCRLLHTQTSNDSLWTALLRPHLPAYSFPSTPAPSPSYRHLYLTHHPRWFLPRNKLWFSDDLHTGKLIVAAYRPGTGRIEGYRLAARRPLSNPVPWAIRPTVIIHTSSPEVYVSLEDPVLSLPHESSSTSNSARSGSGSGPGSSRSTSLLSSLRSPRQPDSTFGREIHMTVGHSQHPINASFFLTRTIPPAFDSPSIEVWPPRTIPRMPRARATSKDKFTGSGHRPAKLEDVSSTTFRTRCWSNYTAGVGALREMGVHIGGGGMGLRVGEEVSTWSTLDEELYLSTKEKPYQGVFVGDYASHGCEFLLVMQGEEEVLPSVERREPREGGYFRNLLAARGLDEDGEMEGLTVGTQGASDGYRVRANVEESEYVHRGCLQAVKLTGDINVPRGEHTFIADDIGAGGFVRVAHERPFRGARVVRSRGHVAARGFREDEFIPTELMLISPDLLAQYWLPFGHISFYKRVDVDALLADLAHEGTPVAEDVNVGFGSAK